MDRNEPLVSIITPCYNGEKHIHRLLDSILQQTYKNIEFIFVNDGSIDSTEQVVLSYKDKFQECGIDFKYISKENGGQASALNAGLKIFKGDYLTWPDSDDWLTEDAIEKKVKFLEANREYGFCISKLTLKNEKMENVGVYWREKQENDNYFFDLIMLKNAYFAPIGNLVRREIFISAIPSKQIYESRAGQNWQMLLPISYCSSIGYLDEVLGYILVRDDSHSRRQKTKDELLQTTYEHEDCLKNTIMYVAPVEMEKYLESVEITYRRWRLAIAMTYRDKVLFSEIFNELKERNKLNFRDKLLYYRINNNFINFVFTILGKFVRTVKK